MWLVASVDNYRSRRAAFSLSHSLSPRNAFIHIRGVEQTGRSSGSVIAASLGVYRMPSWLHRALRDSGSNVIPKRDRIVAANTRPRSGTRPASPALAPSLARDLWGFARIYVCPGRCVWLPRPHPRRVTCGTEAGKPDRRSRPVRPAIHHHKKRFLSLHPPSSYVHGFTRLRVADESRRWRSPWPIDRIADQRETRASRACKVDNKVLSFMQILNILCLFFKMFNIQYQKLNVVR